ncbi:MAG: TlpA family protein disulfide reductase [Bacteroidales bacterium]|jgi:thiol-disulfide isomerase/thioredoxin|nr:TlpA family protein disulfide reductase [Bacteroidales bacterium]
MKNSNGILILTALICVTFSSLFAQNCSIEGILPGAEGREIVLSTVKNYLSQTPEIIQKTTVGEDGSFSFSFTTSKIIPVSLSINYYATTFFIAPDRLYTLRGKNFYFDDFVNPIIAKPMLPLFITNIDELNRFIIRFNMASEKVEESQYYAILSRQDFSAFDELTTSTEYLPETFQSFCSDYQYYTIGSLKAGYSKRRSQKLGTTYLKSRTPSVYDYNYMIFFNAYFTNYLPDHGNNIPLTELITAIFRDQNVQKALSILEKDPILSDETIRQMFLVKFIKDDSRVKHAAVKVLSDLKNITADVGIKEAIDQILTEIMRLAFGTDAPILSLPDAEGKILSSDDLKGKYLYINFFKTTCLDCIAEMESMKNIYAKNSAFFEFISICIDDKEQAFLDFDKNYNYPWKVVYSGFYPDFINQWQAKILPYYVLIDNNYKIKECPAKGPDDGISSIMEKISWEERRKQRAKE